MIGIYERSKTTDASEITLKLDTGFYITCRQIFYKIKSDSYGNRSFLGSQIPTDTMFPSSRIGENYRQCGNCSNCWLEETNILISICPNCDSVTYLVD